MLNNDIMDSLWPVELVEATNQIAGNDEFYNIVENNIDESIKTYLKPDDQNNITHKHLCEYCIVEPRVIACTFCNGSGIVEGKDATFLNCPKCKGDRKIAGNFAIKHTGRIDKIKIDGYIDTTEEIDPETGDSITVESPHIKIQYLMEPGEDVIEDVSDQYVWKKDPYQSSKWLTLRYYSRKDKVRNCHGDIVEGINIKFIDDNLTPSQTSEENSESEGGNENEPSPIE